MHLPENPAGTCLGAPTPAAGESEVSPDRILAAARAEEGCPLGTDEDLLGLSNPPLYTAFPNPFVRDFLSLSPRPPVAPSRDYSREPIAVDISEGRTDLAYLAQNYHTKVPYRAIARYIEHFTEPGDLVLDGFCGSGMVGVAANQTGRRALLCDLSPAATFIAHAFCHPVDLQEATAAFQQLVRDLARECGWMYRGGLEYVIWSDVLLCPHCGAEFPFSEAGFDFERRRPSRGWICACPHCGAALRSNRLKRALDDRGKAKEVPVRVAWRQKGRPREAFPDPAFLEMQMEIEQAPIPYWYPGNLMMNRAPSRHGWGDMWRSGYHAGMASVPDFYFKRTLWTLAAAVHLARSSPAGPAARQLMLEVIVNASTAFTRMRRAYQGVLPLVMYVPKLKREANVIRALSSRFRDMLRCLHHIRTGEEVLITTQSTTSLRDVPDACVDYVFTDPPFGDNIRYSEMNFLWEAWMRVFTNQAPEAIISGGQSKGVTEYQELMRRCFAEMYRALKPGRWATVAFHNSESIVWNAIQQALRDAGFLVEDVRLLDKQQISFKQASAGTPRHDLVISARKAAAVSPVLAPVTSETAPQPDGRFPRDIWEFVQEHLRQLPTPGRLAIQEDALAERRGLELFNRMVAARLSRGSAVPLDVQQFLAGLQERFVERDGLYFLPEQAAEYDRLVASSNTKI